MATQEYSKRPLLLLAAAAYFASLIGWEFGAPRASYSYLVAMIFCLAAIILRKKMVAIILLMVAVFAVFFGRAGDLKSIPNNSIGQIGPRRDLQIIGTIQSIDFISGRTKGIKGILECKSIKIGSEKRDVSGKIRFIGYRTSGEYFQGDQVKMRGSFSLPEPANNPGEFEWDQWAERLKIMGYLRIFANDPDCCQRIKSSLVIKYITIIRNHTLRNINKIFPNPVRGLIMAIVLGKADELEPGYKNRMVIAGFAHILAISGSQISILFIVIFYLFKTGFFNEKQSVILSNILIIAYGFIVGMGAAVFRSVVMLVCITSGVYINKKIDHWSGYAIAGILLLWLEASAAFDPGFQLSFAATAAILKIIDISDQIKVTSIKTFNYIVFSSVISVMIFMAIMGLTIYHFNVVNVGSIVGNIIVVPLFGIIQILALLSILTAYIGKSMGMFLANVCNFVFLLIDKSTYLAQLIPGYFFYVKAINGYALVTNYLLLALCWMSNSIKRIAFYNLLLLIAILTMVFCQKYENESKLTFLSLNSGEAAILRVADKIIVIDTGSENEFIYRVKPFLASQAVSSIDQLVVSHWDNDHAGGVGACFQYFKVKTLITNPFLPRHHDVAEIVRLMSVYQTQWVFLHQGKEFQLSENEKISCSWPEVGARTKTNSESLVISVDINSGRALFPGDCLFGETAKYATPQKCQILKVPHHGDRKGISPEFLSWFLPEVAVVSPGNHNSYGLPDEETMIELEKRFLHVFNTQQQGAVEIYHDASTKVWRLKTWK